MKIIETYLKGVYIIELDLIKDERGFFARTWCQNEFKKYGINVNQSQCNLSFNRKKGTFRGMHYQVAPHEETKLIRCSHGSIYDIAVDLRPDSPTFKKHLSVILSANNKRMLYIPEKFAHGFITLEKNTEIFYQMSEFYSEECARGFRWNDPAFGIQLPLEVAIISDRDCNYPDYEIKHDDP